MEDTGFTRLLTNLFFIFIFICYYTWLMKCINEQDHSSSIAFRKSCGTSWISCSFYQVIFENTYFWVTYLSLQWTDFWCCYRYPSLSSSFSLFSQFFSNFLFSLCQQHPESLLVNHPSVHPQPYSWIKIDSPFRPGLMNWAI